MHRPSADALRGRLVGLVEAERPLRVWSLVVTIFGDLVATRGGELAVGTLTQVVEALGIGGGALRTALSRLDAEGLIERRKVGRNSYARLTGPTMAEFRAASERIYAGDGPPWSGAWSVALLPEGANGNGQETRAALEHLGYRTLAAGVMLAARGPEAARARLPEAIVLDAAAAPADLARLAARALPLAEADAAYGRFLAGFAPIRDLLAVRPAEAFDLVLTRVVLIHAYRRLVLRYPAIPDALTPPEWPGRAARHLAAEIYTAARDPSERWLDAHATNADGPLPPPTDAFRRRFAGA